MSEGAREALIRAASAFPGGEALVGQVIQAARESLSDSIHHGFVFILFASGFAIIAALLMKNIRLEARGTEPAVPGGEAQRDQEPLVALEKKRTDEPAHGRIPGTRA